MSGPWILGCTIFAMALVIGWTLWADARDNKTNTTTTMSN